ncbi:hypothetical protein ACLK17_20845 [Escherichia coli]
MILEGAVTNVTNFGAFVDMACIRTAWFTSLPLSNEFVKDSAYRGESGRHCEGESAGSGSSA